MFVVVIREADDTLNIVGPFWHENAAHEFVDKFDLSKTAYVESVTDRDMFGDSDDETART